MGWCAKIYCFSGGLSSVGGCCSPPARENNSVVRAAPAHCPRIFSELPPSSRCFPGRVIPLLCARHLPLWDQKQLYLPPPYSFSSFLSFTVWLFACYCISCSASLCPPSPINPHLPPISAHSIVSLSPFIPTFPLISAHSIVSGRTFKLTRPDARRGECGVLWYPKGEDISIHRR